MVFTYILAFITICWVFITIYLLINTHKIGYLKNQSITQHQPSLAIIIAMRNEETEVEKALSSICHINYNHYRIIAINDRSTDHTGAILDKLVLQHPQISAIHVRELPPHWLGKNHALYQGYLHATEEWLLFTDADVVFEQNAILKAIAYAQRQQLDHLAVLPHIESRSTVLNSILETFSIMLILKLRLWEVPSARSKASVGIGAFNLVRKTAYEKAGTHTAIRLRPDDDLKLGEHLKQSGGKQDVLYGEDTITLEWYSSVRQFVNGLMKNTFSVSDYNTAKAITAALATFIFFCAPVLIGLLTGSLLNAGLLAIVIIAQWALFAFKAGHPNRWWHFLMIPAAGAIITYIIIRSTFITLKQGGIYWRDSFYPLKELKSGLSEK